MNSKDLGPWCRCPVNSRLWGYRPSKPGLKIVQQGFLPCFQSGLLLTSKPGFLPLPRMECTWIPWGLSLQHFVWLAPFLLTSNLACGVATCLPTPKPTVQCLEKCHQGFQQGSS